MLLPLGAAELSGVRAVYMLPMSNGMDQYLANRLINLHAVQVVTDPQRADAILTDRLGPGFEDKLQELYPPPPEEKDKDAKDNEKDEAKADADADKDKGDKDDGKDNDKDEAKPDAASRFGDPVNKLPKAGSMSSFGRAKGTIFLVDVKTRQVLWSIYQRPKNSTPQQLDKTAVHIVNQLKQDIAGNVTQP